MERFADLCDQLSAYEEAPNSLHYTTRFLDGLKPGVRIAVALQKPRDLDAAYDLALLHEELGEGITPLNHVSSARSGPMPLPLPPYKHRSSEDKRSLQVQKPVLTEDKWSALRNFRKSKGLYFVCGEKWSKDHVCKSSVQLHIVQELIDHIQSEETISTDSSIQDQMSVCSMQLSAAAVGKQSSAPTLQLLIELQGMELILLVDSGSTHSFVACTDATTIQGISSLPVYMVKVANGSFTTRKRPTNGAPNLAINGALVVRH